MSKTIQNSGQLREFLVNMMLGVKDGVIDTEDAANIVKLAQQVNESFYAEAKTAKVRFDLGGEALRGLGLLPINTDPNGANGP